MKKLILVAAAVLFAVGLGLSAAVAADAPKEAIKVTNYGSKAAVTFDHAKHKEVKCVDCHHNEAEGKYKCGDCHGKDAQGKAVKMKDAAHSKEGKCYECHYAKDAPHKFKCNDCHKG